MGFDFGIGELFAGTVAADAAATAAGAGTAAAVGTAAAGTAAAGTAAASTAALSAGEASLLASAAAASAAPIAGTAAAAGGGLLSAGTLANIGLGTTLASSALGAAGAVRSAQAQGDAAKYQAQVDLNNRNLSAYYADTAAAKGASDLSREQQKQKQQMDLIIASQAASGVDVGSGSSQDVRKSQDILNNLDALTIMSNTAQQYYGHSVQGTSFGNQASLESARAGQSGTEAALGATSSLVSGASGAANQYLNWQRVAGGPTANLPDSSPAATGLGNFY